MHQGRTRTAAPTARVASARRCDGWPSATSARGPKAKYYKSLSDWCAATGGDSAEVEGIPGASVGAGRTLIVSLDLAEALFDAGYELHNDAAVEDLRDSPSEIVLPLGTEGLSRPVAGGCITSFTCEM
ncbi:DUF2271 domain-containing protein [Rhodovulum sulfidophilum]|uniref:DUF2271 domain-containing protein n=1 Tax=Rhodovulum sulfidophilum TaxID=35806 RepID=UPI003075C321